MYKKTIIIFIILFTIQFFYFNNKINKLENNNNLVEISNEYLTFKNSDNNKTGQIFSNNNKFIIYGFVEKDLEIGTGGNIVINSGKDKIELQVGTDNKIKITEDRIDIFTKEFYINNKLIK